MSREDIVRNDSVLFLEFWTIYLRLDWNTLHLELLQINLCTIQDPHISSWEPWIVHLWEFFHKLLDRVITSYECIPIKKTVLAFEDVEAILKNELKDILVWSRCFYISFVGISKLVTMSRKYLVPLQLHGKKQQGDWTDVESD